MKNTQPKQKTATQVGKELKGKSTGGTVAWPVKPPPRFALPGHEWRPSGWITSKGDGCELIREVDGWVLLRRVNPVKPPLVVKHEMLQRSKRSKQVLENPGDGFFPPNSSPELRQASSLSRVMDNLAILALNSMKEAEAIEAAALLEWLVKKGCKLLMQIANEKPSVLIPTAEKECEWPMLVSRHPGYGVSLIKHYRHLLRELRLGTKADVDINETSRNGTQGGTRRAKEFAQHLLNCLLAEGESTDHRIDRRPLPAFTDEHQALVEWSEQAKDLLFEAYPEPMKVEELLSLVAPSRRKTKAHVKADVWEKIRDAFHKLAPLSNERTGTP